MKRAVWAFSAVSALAVLGLLALQAPDRPLTLVEHQAEGMMRHLATSQITSVRANTNTGSRTFRRGSDGRWSVRESDKDVALPEDANAAIEAGLRLLHNTRPERSFESDSPEFGLATPTLSILATSADGQTVEATFGASNPIGLSTYVRVNSKELLGVHLMPSYVANAWSPALSWSRK